jgi:hypothetical protein
LRVSQFEDALSILTDAIDAYRIDRMLQSMLFVSLLAGGQPAGKIPPIGVIEVYGARRVTEQQVLQASQLKVGDPFPSAAVVREAKARITKIPGVSEVRLTGGCCDEGQSTISIGIQEVGTAALRFRPEPRGSVRLPDDIVKAGAAFDEAWEQAILSGHTEDDGSQGHSLLKDPAVRAIQDRFVVFAARDLSRLRAVLHDASDASQRALAAQVIAYTSDKRAVIGDLIEGVQDPSDGVRNNAMRALSLIAMFAQRNPMLGIVVPPTPFVDLLNSIEWTDLNKSSMALAELTQARDPVLMADLRARALPSLIEIARWKSHGHAEAASLVLGRIVGLQDDEIQAAFERGDRALVLDAATKLAK